ncbi:hypothetical protein [Microcoleus sp.]|uniref:hypothetical protein n=1 Tax=Microcoleus sp. TaxID=44472 RepID=UPI0035948872
MSNETKIWTSIGQSYLTKDNSIDVNIASSERYQLSISESGESGEFGEFGESGEFGEFGEFGESGYDRNFSIGQPVNSSNSSPVTGNFPMISQGYERGDNFYQIEIEGTNGNDILTGIPGNNVSLEGRRGNDILSGNNGNDELEGGKGQDTLDGGAGNDIIDGGRGKDLLTGGMGSDIFELEGRSATNILDLADIITDFQKGADILELEDGLRFSNINITQGTGIYAADTLLQIASTGQYLAVLKGVNAGNINQADFIFS